MGCTYIPCDAAAGGCETGVPIRGVARECVGRDRVGVGPDEATMQALLS